MTQQRLADLIGIPRDRLSTYEKKRAPVRVDLALRVCRQLIISEEWLATGHTKIMEAAACQRFHGPSGNDLATPSWIFQRQCYDLASDPVALTIPPRTLFSEAFDHSLIPAYTSWATKSFYLPRIVFVDERQEPDLAGRYMTLIFDRSIRLLQHLAEVKGVEPWPVQRNYLRAMVQFALKAYEEFVDLGLEAGDFQHFIRSVAALGRSAKKPDVETKVA